jgi:glutamate-1-semialdehyde aminotransferase
MVFKKIEENELEQFINEADQKKNTPKKVKKFNKPLQVYLTEEERKKVVSYAREQGLSASALVRILLKEKGII